MRPTKMPPAEDVDLVLSFINAMSPGHENVCPSGTLRQWLAKHGDRFQAGELTEDDHERARAARAGLHALIRSGQGAGNEQAVEELSRLTAAAAIRPHFTADGTTTLTPSSDGFDGVLEHLFAIVVRARLEHHWPRFKICTDKACGRAFYDASRPLNRRWCSRTCGNRHNAKGRRRRPKTAP